MIPYSAYLSKAEKRARVIRQRHQDRIGLNVYIDNCAYMEGNNREVSYGYAVPGKHGTVSFIPIDCRKSELAIEQLRIAASQLNYGVTCALEYIRKAESKQAYDHNLDRIYNMGFTDELVDKASDELDALVGELIDDDQFYKNIEKLHPEDNYDTKST